MLYDSLTVVLLLRLGLFTRLGTYDMPYDIYITCHMHMLHMHMLHMHMLHMHMLAARTVGRLGPCWRSLSFFWLPTYPNPVCAVTSC